MSAWDTKSKPPSIPLTVAGCLAHKFNFILMNSLETFAKIIPNTSPAFNSPILTDVEVKARKVINGLNSSMYENSNEASIGLYRIQEHVRKTVPVIMDRTGEMENYMNKIKGSKFDLEYSIEAVQKVSDSEQIVESITKLMIESLELVKKMNIKKNAMSRRTEYIYIIDRYCYSTDLFLWFYQNFMKNSKKKYIYFSDLTRRHFSQLKFQLPNLSNDFSNSLIANAASAMVNTIFSLANSFISYHSISIGLINRLVPMPHETD
ncbi:MEF2BNB isoform X1 [Brachionus plicatilis]|uniref:MEF2BNB isoform X1 n=1 Tax=Brachionus plicatilis TaxID=10195 RepID=A0A3M7QML7_BRAPC|nr:MEF2BNB isoform X1 [Brachionus plicatilis]